MSFLPEGWRQTTLSDIACDNRTGLVDGPFGSDLPSSAYQESGIPIIRGNNLSKGDVRFKDRDFVYISEETAARLSRSLCAPTDIVFTKKGTLGQIGIIPTDGTSQRYLLSSNQMKLSVDREKADPLFIYYQLASPQLIKKIIRDSEHTGVPKINLTYLKSLPVLVPPLKEQKAISAILNALDDKIELNRRMNATFEAATQALFESWFVDFDPVKAKAEGRAPEGMDADTAKHFSSEFVESELGPIPKGWEVATLAESCNNIFSGGTPSTQVHSYWGGTIPWLSSGETRSRFIIDTEKTITEAGVANSSTRLARPGCTVIAAAGQGHTRGQASLLTIESYINQSVVALAANPKVSSDLFLFFDMGRRYEQFRQLSDSHSSRGSLTTKLLAGVKLVLPPREIVSKFDSVVEPLIARITANFHQARTLVTVRDVLLPKLISGKFRIPGIEEAEGSIE